MMDFFSFVKDKSKELSQFNLDMPESFVWELVEFCASMSKQDIICGKLNSNLNETSFQSSFNALFDRLKSGEPLQQITGRAYFRDIKLEMNSSVLIPRPETEMLVDIAKDYLDSNNIETGSAMVGDICTGSGCIAISVAKETGAYVFATDISEECISIAKKNAELNDISEKCEFLYGNLCDPLRSRRGTFDCILSNPPYVPASVYETLKWSVKNFEPEIALEAGDDGCKYMGNLSDGAYALLKHGGLFACEIFDGNSNDFKGIVERAGFSDAEIVKDLAGKPRFVVAFKN